jgi:hypothetical protein
MRWRPVEGHVPRGFLGATGDLEEVELVLVFAEPGDPMPGEIHSGMDTAYAAADYFFRTPRDAFHRNVRKVLDQCWPELSFDQQLRKVWMTDSVLCSAPVECGPVSRGAESACGKNYLKAQLALFPNALVVALGNKAQDRLKRLGIGYLAVYAVAPPGCNHRKAAASWEKIPYMLKAHYAARTPLTSSSYDNVEKNSLVGSHIGDPKVPTLPPYSTSVSPNDFVGSAPRPSSRQILSGPYTVINKTALRATSETDPGKWSIWKHIWASTSFEELRENCLPEAYTITNRRITPNSEALWALKRGWIRKVERSPASLSTKASGKPD